MLWLVTYCSREVLLTSGCRDVSITVVLTLQRSLIYTFNSVV